METIYHQTWPQTTALALRHTKLDFVPVLSSLLQLKARLSQLEGERAEELEQKGAELERCQAQVRERDCTVRLLEDQVHSTSRADWGGQVVDGGIITCSAWVSVTCSTHSTSEFH